MFHKQITYLHKKRINSYIFSYCVSCLFSVTVFALFLFRVKQFVEHHTPGLKTMSCLPSGWSTTASLGDSQLEHVWFLGVFFHGTIKEVRIYQCLTTTPSRYELPKMISVPRVTIFWPEIKDVMVYQWTLTMYSVYSVNELFTPIMLLTGLITSDAFINTHLYIL